MGECQAYLHYRFGTRILFLTILEAAEISLVQMGKLAYLIAGYASRLKKLRKDLRETIGINPMPCHFKPDCFSFGPTLLGCLPLNKKARRL
jgi:hypothetical protein